MEKSIYFSKIEYWTHTGYGEVSNIILLDIKSQELPYCNVSDFELYRDKEMSMDDPGYIG
ncbi:MAG: hypothetical protein RR139_11405 [Lachnospiraceae bacterium]